MGSRRTIVGGAEADETYIGFEPNEPERRGGTGHKMKVVSLLDRETGAARSMVMDFVTTGQIARNVAENLSAEAHLMTDESPVYLRAGKTLARHSSVNHKNEEYARYEGELTISTNALEGYFSIFKRGMKGRLSARQ